MERSIKEELFSIESKQLMLTRKAFSKTTHSFAVTTSNPLNQKYTIGWFAAHSPTAIQHLGRKIPHYKKYSYLVFKGDKAENVYKGKWPLDDSALNFTTAENRTTPELLLTPHPALTHSKKAHK